MVKHFVGLSLAVVLLLPGQTGCEKKKTDADLKREKEAQWRARQTQQAIKYYSDLVKNYPDSPHVGEARQHLDALKPAATPPKK